MKEYSQKMAKAQDDIEQQKQKKLRDVRKLLKEERLKRKKELYKYVFQQQCKKFHVKALLNSFHLNGHILGVYVQRLKLERPCTV